VCCSSTPTISVLKHQRRSCSISSSSISIGSVAPWQACPADPFTACCPSHRTCCCALQALPAVTQEAGFVPSAATLTVVCLFSAVTGQHICMHIAQLGCDTQN
jgi:hypothetical protein